MSVVDDARRNFHAAMCLMLYGRRDTAAREYSNADASSKVSTAFAKALGDELVAKGFTPTDAPLDKPQTVGMEFGHITSDFLTECFDNGFASLRPGKWGFKPEATLSDFYQYAHLADLQRLGVEYRDAGDYWMAAVVGGDYHVVHDVLMYRQPETLAELNGRAGSVLLDEAEARSARTPLLHRNQQQAIVHAAVSTKWTLRSDRAQNVRTEALNLQKHRKGRTPHLVAVTAETLPSRLASLALGTGEIDCVYHVALDEFLDGARKSAAEAGLHAATSRARREQLVTLEVLVKGRQLRDIADLPFDLVM